MNLMHSTIGITDGIYAVLSDDDIQAKIANLGKGKADDQSGHGHKPAVSRSICRNDETHRQGEIMTGLQVHYSSKAIEWATPLDLFQRLDREFEFYP